MSKKNSFLIVGVVAMLFLSILMRFDAISNPKELIIQKGGEITNPQESKCAPVWNRTYGGINLDQGESVWANDSGVYIVGTTYSYGAGNSDILLIKYDTNGNPVWTKTFGGYNYEFGKSIWGNETGIYLCGISYTYGAGNADMIIIRCDGEGNQFWNHTWGGMLDDEANGIWVDATGIYTVGTTESYGAGLKDLALIKWDAEGNQAWNVTFGSVGDERGNALWSNGNYIFTVGNTNGSGNYSDVLINSWDVAGNLNWDEAWGGALADEAYGIWGNGSYLYICGSTNNYGNGNSDILFLKYQLSGSLSSQNYWGTPQNECGFDIWANGTSAIICANISGVGIGYTDMLLMYTDAWGNSDLNRTWGGANDDEGKGLFADDSMVFYSTGITKSYGVGNGDLLLVKWDITKNYPPVIKSPGNVQFVINTEDCNFTWWISDSDMGANPTYTLYFEGNPVSPRKLYNYMGISIMCDTLTVGEHTFRVVANDDLGGISEDTVVVSIITPPSSGPGTETPSVTNTTKNETKNPMKIDGYPIFGLVSASGIVVMMAILNGKRKPTITE